MSRPFFSIAIPTWEVNGKGAEYLDFSMNRLAQQTFKDFEIVVSDHSRNDDVFWVCENWLQYMDIEYYRNANGRGRIAPNLNNALSYCRGEYTKILFQDDFLYDENSLMIVKDAIVSSYSTNHIETDTRWLVTGCCHTKDGENLYDQMIPAYNNDIHRGYNTISCPSVLTIKNDIETIAFDEEYNWLCDCVYYKELYNKFGPPIIVSDVCVVNRDAEVRTTNMLSQEQKQEEVLRSIKKYEQSYDNLK